MTIRVQEVAKLGRLPVDVGCTVEWQREQRGCEGLGCGEPEGSRPPLDTCSYTRAAQQRWCGARAAARQKPNELSGLGAPPAAKLEGEDNEAAGLSRGDTKVVLVFGTKDCRFESCQAQYIPQPDTTLRFFIAHHGRRHIGLCLKTSAVALEGSADNQASLITSPKGTCSVAATCKPPMLVHRARLPAGASSICVSAVTSTFLLSTHNCDLRRGPTRVTIGGDGGAGFTADPGCGPLKRDAPGAQKSNTWASSAVVAKLIKPGAAAAPGRVEREWHPESPEEQDPEGGGLEAELGGRGECGEHTGSEWASLRLEERL